MIYSIHICWWITTWDPLLSSKSLKVRWVASENHVKGIEASVGRCLTHLARPPTHTTTHINIGKYLGPVTCSCSFALESKGLHKLLSLKMSGEAKGHFSALKEEVSLPYLTSVFKIWFWLQMGEGQTDDSPFTQLVSQTVCSLFLLWFGGQMFLLIDEEVVVIPYGFLSTYNATHQHFKSLDRVRLSHSFMNPKGNKQLLTPMCFWVVLKINQNKKPWNCSFVHLLYSFL